MPNLLSRLSRWLSRPTANLRGHEDGSILVETAAIMPVFLLLIFGFINFSLIMFGLCNLSYATRYALRYACLHSSTSLLPASQTDLNNILGPYLFPYPANTYLSSLSYSGTNNIGSQVTVTVTITYTLNFPFIPASALNFSTQATGIITQ